MDYKLEWHLGPPRGPPLAPPARNKPQLPPQGALIPVHADRLHHARCMRPESLARGIRVALCFIYLEGGQSGAVHRPCARLQSNPWSLIDQWSAPPVTVSLAPSLLGYTAAHYINGLVNTLTRQLPTASSARDTVVRDDPEGPHIVFESL